jgi:hypothetical protein
MEVTQSQSVSPPAESFTAPGEADLRVSDINSNDPLIHLGLVDLSGNALPSDDWQPASPPQPVAASAVPAQPAAPQPQTPAPVDYSAGQTYQQTAQVLQAQAAAAYDRAISQGADPKQAEAIIGARLDAELARAESRSVRAAAAPTVKAQVANHIASTLGGNLVTPQDLMAYDSPQAMEAAASQLAQARRNSNYQARRQSGVDRAEGVSSPAGINPAIAGLSPEKKIELGIRRGQY